MKKLLIRDPIYGNVTITDQVLLDLIESKPIQRLKRIDQHGLPYEFWKIHPFSRYDHSVGVMLLLKSLGASIEEQIAGLLHDVSHTAFSHLVDWVIGDAGSESYQDRRHKSVIKESIVAEILTKHGFSTDRISNLESFYLLEREIPNLCADRVDYALREFELNIAEECYNHLITYNNEIVFGSKDQALIFAVNFLKAQSDIWASFEGVSRYSIMANLLRSAITKSIISFDDFFEDDLFIINKLESSSDENTQYLLNMLRKDNLTDLPKSQEITYKKFRHVDPKILLENKIARLSEISKDFKAQLEAARIENQKGLHTAIV